MKNDLLRTGLLVYMCCGVLTANCRVDSEQLNFETSEFRGQAIAGGRVILNHTNGQDSGILHYEGFESSAPKYVLDLARGPAILYQDGGRSLVFYCNHERQFEFDWILAGMKMTPALRWQATRRSRMAPPDLSNIVAFSGTKVVPVATRRSGARLSFAVTDTDDGQPIVIDPVLKWNRVVGAQANSTILKIKKKTNGNLIALFADLVDSSVPDPYFLVSTNHTVQEFTPTGERIRSSAVPLPNGYVRYMELDAKEDIVLLACQPHITFEDRCLSGGTLVKLNASLNGAEVFRKTLPEALGDWALAITSNNDVFVAGSGDLSIPLRSGRLSPSAGAAQRQADGPSDCFVTRYSANGAELAATVLGSAGKDWCWTMATTPRGTLLVGVENVPLDDNGTRVSGIATLRHIGSPTQCNGTQCQYPAGLLVELDLGLTKILQAADLHGLVIPEKIKVQADGSLLLAGVEELGPEFRVVGSYAPTPQSQYYVGVVQTTQDFAPATIAIRYPGAIYWTRRPFVVQELWTDSEGNIALHYFSDRQNIALKNELYHKWDNVFCGGGTTTARKRCYYNAVVKFNSSGTDLLYATYLPIVSPGATGRFFSPRHGPPGAVEPIAGGFLYAGSNGMEVSAFPSSGIVNRTGFIAEIDDARHQLTYGDSTPIDGAAFSADCNQRAVCSLFFAQPNGDARVTAAAGYPLPETLDGLTLETGVGRKAKLFAVIRTATFTQVNFLAPVRSGSDPLPEILPGINVDEFERAYMPQTFGYRLIDHGRAGVFRTILHTYPQGYCRASSFLYNGRDVAALHGNTANLVTADNPARAGQVISLFLTGLEANVSNAPEYGFPALASPLSVSLNRPRLYVGGKEAAILFSGLAPGTAGVSQINFVVPEGLSSGEAAIRLDYNRHPQDPAPCPDRGVLSVR